MWAPKKKEKCNVFPRFFGMLNVLSNGDEEKGNKARL